VGSFLVFLLLAAVARRAVSGVLTRLHVNRDVIQLLGQVLFYTLVVMGLVTGLGTMGVHVGGLIAGLGLGGFAVGFALRDAISNVLAGVMLLIHQPFRVGQRIGVAGLEGRVTEINLRYTILQADDAHHLIPNQMLFTNTVKVHHTS